MKHLLTIATLLTLSASALSAGRSEANACAAKLEGDSKLIYERVAPKVTSDRSKNEAMVKSTVKAMIDKGEVAFFGARKSAKAAVACASMINT